VGSRKLGLSLGEIGDVLAAVRATCEVQPLTVEVHETGLGLIDRYGFSVYAAMIVASALLAGATTLHSEDMQDGLGVDGGLRIVNPYAVR